MNTMNICFGIFKFLCIIVTVIMIGFWFNKFYTNKSSTLIEYKRIDNIEDFIFPELSLCFATPFITNYTRDKIFQQSYRLYLLGVGCVGENGQFIEWEKCKDFFENINYDHVTPNPSDYLELMEIKWKPGTNYSNNSVLTTRCHNTNRCPYASFNNIYNGITGKDHFYKCFGLNIKRSYAKHIVNLFFGFKSEFKKILDQIDFVMARFYQPNQFVRGEGVDIPLWIRSGSPNNTVAEGFKINSVEIFKRRNTRNSQCTMDWKNYDDWVNI